MRKLLAVLLALSLLLSGTVVADDALEAEEQQSVEQTNVNPETGTALTDATQNKSEPDANANTATNADDPVTGTGANTDTAANGDDPTTGTGADTAANADDPATNADANGDGSANVNASKDAAAQTTQASDDDDAAALAGTPMLLSEEGSSTCAHENVYDWGGWRDMVFSYLNEKEHSFTGTLVHSHKCQDCGESWEETEPGSDQEPHHYVDGVCDRCNYVNTCTHDNVNSWSVWDDATYSSLGTEGHEVNGYCKHVNLCQDCNLYQEEKDTEKSSAQEAHSFVEGTCIYCGYECQHSYPSSGSGICKYCSMECEHVPGPIEYNEYNHRQSCSVCGKWLMYYEDHSFVDGICEVCGFDGRYQDGCVDHHPVSCLDSTVCLVSGEKTYTDRTERVHATANGTEATFSYENGGAYGHYRTCDLCGRMEWDDHTFNDDGVCVYCGARESCADGCEGYHVVSCSNPSVCLRTGATVQSDENVSTHHGADLDSEYKWTQDIAEITSTNHVTRDTCEGCGEAMLCSEGHCVDCKNLTCEICGYTVPEELASDRYLEYRHKLGEEYETNAYEHWKVCQDCGAKVDSGAHWGGDQCVTCGIAYDVRAHQHTVECGGNVCLNCGETVTVDENVLVSHEDSDHPDAYVDLGNGFHAMRCVRCNEITGIEPHGWGYIMDRGYSHSDENGHGFLCECGAFWIAPHRFDAKGLCLDCEYTSGGEIHSLESMRGIYYFDSEQHWKYCVY